MGNSTAGAKSAFQKSADLVPVDDILGCRRGRMRRGRHIRHRKRYQESDPGVELTHRGLGQELSSSGAGEARGPGAGTRRAYRGRRLSAAFPPAGKSRDLTARGRVASRPSMDGLLTSVAGCTRCAIFSPELLAFGFSNASGANCALLLSLIALSIEVRRPSRPLCCPSTCSPSTASSTPSSEPQPGMETPPPPRIYACGLTAPHGILRVDEDRK